MTVGSYPCPVASEAGKTASEAPDDPVVAGTVEAAGALRAWRLAAEAHAGQLRAADQRPYIHHPERVAIARRRRGRRRRDDRGGAAARRDRGHATSGSTGSSATSAPTSRSLVAALTDDPAIDDYEARKQALRDQVREAGERAALIYAADKLANSSDLRDAYAEIGEGVVGRLKISLDGRIRIWRDDLVMCRELLGERDVIAALDES